jgi:muconolactone delta-isomerase
VNFLVICRRAPDGDTDAFSRLVASERDVLRKLHRDGVLTSAWSPGGPGAVLILDLPDQVAVERITSDLPLAAAGLITTEVIPLHPLDF